MGALVSKLHYQVTGRTIDHSNCCKVHTKRIAFRFEFELRFKFEFEFKFGRELTHQSQRIGGNAQDR